MVVSFIGGGNQNTQKKPPTYHKSLTNLSHNVVLSTPLYERVRTNNFSGDRHRLHR